MQNGKQNTQMHTNDQGHRKECEKQLQRGTVQPQNKRRKHHKEIK